LSKKRDHRRTERKEHYAQLKPQRIELLRGIIAKHRPQAIVAYGKGFWPDDQQLLPNASFEEASGFQIAPLTLETGNMGKQDNGNTGLREYGVHHPRARIRTKAASTALYLACE
jgi:hypothetical protein